MFYSLIKNCLTTLIICSCYSCIPQPESTCIKINNPTYDFNLPITLSPAIDTFNIGDTITIFSEFPEEMVEVHSGELVELIDWNFFPITSLYKIDEEEIIDTVLNTFEVLIDTEYSYSFYEFNDGKIVLKGQYNYENSIYKLEYKLIPTEAGLYFHALGSTMDFLAPDSEFENKCPNTSVGAYVKMTNIEDNNAMFLLDSPNEDVHIWYERKDKGGATFNNIGGYCFYVR